MEQDVFISIVLDKRRLKSNNLYPVKLRVYSKSFKTQKLYPTKFEMNEREFSSTWETLKPRQEFKENRIKLYLLENQAIEVAGAITPFNFEAFREKKLAGQRGDRGQRILSILN